MAITYGQPSSDLLISCLGLFVMSVPVFSQEDNSKDFCSPPMRIDHGSYNPSRKRYRIGEKVSYACDDSKIYLFGENTLECEGNDKWKGTVPYCAFPEGIKNVYHDGSNQPALIDRNERHCADSGRIASWKISTKEIISGRVAIKIIVADLCSGCSSHNVLLDAKVEGGSCTVDAIIPEKNTADGNKYFQYKFDCEVRKEASNFEIAPTLVYNFQIKLCEIYIYRKKGFSCSPNITIQNGGVKSPRNVSKIAYGESIVFHCNEGYRLEGCRNYLRCKNGIYDCPLPRCEPVGCPNAPPLVTNGEWLDWNVSNQYFYGNTFVVSCETGYEISDGINFTQCQHDGSWSGQDVTCFKADMAASLLVPIVASVMSFVFVIVVLIITCILCSRRRNVKNSTSRKSEHIYNEPTYYSSDPNVQQHKVSPPIPPLRTRPSYSDPLDNYYTIDDEYCYYEPCSSRKDNQVSHVFQSVNKDNPIYVCQGEDESIQDNSGNEQRAPGGNIPKNDISVENELYSVD